MISLGLAPGLSFERYTSVDRINVSTLKDMARSALHYRYRLAHQRTTPPLELGKAGHAAVLEPERFDREFVVWAELTDSGNLRPRRGKDFDAFVDANKGKTILKPDEHRFALNVREAVQAKPVARKYLAKGIFEVSMFWNDAETEAECKGRIDMVTHVDGIDCLVGLKTSRDLEPRAFANQAARLRYYLQWAFYFDGYTACTGVEPRMVEICVEVEPPHDVVVYVIPSDVIEYGREEYRALLGRVKECKAANRWPGRADNELAFALPAYLRTEADDEDVTDLDLDVDPDARKRSLDWLNEGVE